MTSRETVMARPAPLLGSDLPYRADIDGLRAYAVMAVLGFHFFPGWAPNGFLGVDVFFVVSGYLITGLLLREAADGRVRLLQFYARRIRRLFPAMLVVLAASAAAAYAVLFSFEFDRFIRHILASLAFVQNFNLANEVGYFDGDARAKPLLHFWSLAVEEQFYIVWPLLLLVLGRRPRLVGGVIAAALAASLVLTVGGVIEPGLAFYSPLTRAWELAAGGLLAWGQSRGLSLNVRDGARNLASMAGLGLVTLCVFLAPAGLSHPGWWTVAPIAGAVLVIAAGPGTWFNRRVLAHPVAVRVGLLSYPLYLWHWPLLAFPFIVTGEPLPATVRLGLMGLSFLLAWATWRWIERPSRTMASPARVAGFLLAGAIALVAAVSGAALVHTSARDSREAAIQAQLTGPLWAHTRNAWCEQRYGLEYRYFCILSRDESPTVILIGDSYANHFYAGVVSHPAMRGESVLSFGACDASGIYPGDRSDCARQDQIVASTPSLKLAIVSSLWPRFNARGAMVDHWTGQVGDLAGYPGAEPYARALRARLLGLRARGLRVIVVGPKPEVNYDVADCFPRPFRAAKRDCRVTAAAAADQTDVTARLLQQVADSIPGVTYHDPRPLLCDAAECRLISPEGLPWLRDNGHYSEYGSARVSEVILSGTPRG